MNETRLIGKLASDVNSMTLPIDVYTMNIEIINCKLVI